MGSSLLSEEQSKRRQKEVEAEGDIQQLQTAVSLCSVVSGCFPAEQQTAVKSRNHAGVFFFFFLESEVPLLEACVPRAGWLILPLRLLRSCGYVAKCLEGTSPFDLNWPVH